MKFRYTATEGGYWKEFNCGKLNPESVINTLVNKTNKGNTASLMLRDTWKHPLVVCSILFRSGQYWTSLLPNQIVEYSKIWEGLA